MNPKDYSGSLFEDALRILQAQALVEAQANADAATLRIFDALRAETPIKFVYVDQDGIASLREAIPTAVRKCLNGRVVVEAFDLNRKAARKFRMGSISLL